MAIQLVPGAFGTEDGAVILGGGGGGGGGAPGDVTGPGSATDDNIAAFDGTTGKLIKDGGITATAVSGHVSSTSNPHATDVGNLGSGTLAELNTAITDATLDDSSDPRTPTAHAASHEDGGSDEISVLNLSGLLADGQTPLAHATSHENGGSDEINIAGLSGVLADNQPAIPAAGLDTTAIHNNVAGEIAAITNKATPIGADYLVIEDSAAANVKKHILISSLPASGSALSEYSRVTTYQGKGSTNGNIIRWTTQAASNGSNITYTNSATLGGYWAISATGIYTVSVSINGQSNNTGPYYINLAAALSDTLDAAHIRAVTHGVAYAGGGPVTLSWAGPAASGDVIWISTGSTPTASTTLNTVTVTRVQ